MNLFELFVKIGVDDNGFKKGINGAKDNFGKFSAWTVAKGQLIADGIKAGGKALIDFGKQAINSYAEYEQLAGGAKKIFDQMDYSKIATDANNAYKELGLSANQYLAVINDVGATFAATMGDEAGYEAAKTGLKAISDYASGTGKNVDELSQKFTLITRSTSSYQSIADQFSGILPATSDAFLEQAQAAGILSDNYTKLTEVPIDEYQAAVSQMLQQGVSDLGLANNTMNEAFSTLSGSLSMAKGAWSNLVTGLADDSADLDVLIGNFVDSVGAVATNLIPKIGTALNGASKLVRDLIPVIVQEIPVLIKENLPILAEAAISIIQSLVDGISANAAQLIDSAIQIITVLGNGIYQMLPTVAQSALQIVLTLVSKMNENLPQMLDTAGQMLIAFVEGVSEHLPDIMLAAASIVETLLTYFIEHLPDIVEGAMQMGNAVIDGIIDGISAAWDSLVSWFNGLWDSLFGGRNVDVNVNANATSSGVNGSHAGGLDYVPFDGYIAELHRGERVLTAKQAAEYNNQRPNVNVVQNIYSEAKTAADLMQEALYQQERAVLLGV